MVSDAHENWTSKGEIDRDVLKLGFNHLNEGCPYSLFDRDSIIEYIEAFLANLDKIKNPSGAGETSTMTRNSLKRNKNVKDEHAFAVVLSTMSERK